MIAHPRPLMAVFARIPDLRKPRGQRHPCAALGALACWAMVCGARRESALAAWGHKAGARIAPALDFTHATPCAATLPTLLRYVHRDACAAHLGAWADQVVGSLPPGPETPAMVVALEGKRDEVPPHQGPGPPWYRRWRPRWAAPAPTTPWTTPPRRARPSRPSCRPGSGKVV